MEFQGWGGESEQDLVLPYFVLAFGVIVVN
jgi:hypothetical protein